MDEKYFLSVRTGGGVFVCIFTRSVKMICTAPFSPRDTNLSGPDPGRRKVLDTERVRQGNCSTILGVVRLGLVGQLPCRTSSVSDNFLHLPDPLLIKT